MDKIAMIEECDKSYNAYCINKVCIDCKYNIYEQDCRMVYGIEYTLEKVAKELLKTNG